MRRRRAAWAAPLRPAQRGEPLLHGFRRSRRGADPAEGLDDVEALINSGNFATEASWTAFPIVLMAALEAEQFCDVAEVQVLCEVG